MIEAVAQQAGTDAGCKGEEGALKQAFAERRFNRCGVDSRWGNNAPGHRTLGYLELESLPGNDHPRQVGRGDGEPTLEVVELFDQLRLFQELVVQVPALLFGVGNLFAIEIEGQVNGVELLATQ